MRSEKLLPEKKLFLGTGCFLLAMMAIGSVWDYPISQTAYNPHSPFGLFLRPSASIPRRWGLLPPAPCCWLPGTGKSI